MKLVLLISFLCIFSFAQSDPSDNVQKFLDLVWKALQAIASKVHLHPDTGLSIAQFLDKYNYTLETHNVTTDDGYILSMHRIPGVKSKQSDEIDEDSKKPVAFFAHGLSSSSMDWLFQGPTESLPLLLVGKGYDVWLANLRGNTYSSHKTLTRKDAAFWDYSFHERGYYDLPALIDYVLALTSVDNLTYIGHSEGTTNGLVLTATRPEYNAKINLMALLSPVAYMGNLTSPVVRLLAENESLFKMVMNLLDLHGTTYNPATSVIVDVFCNDDSSLQDLCISILSLLSGFDMDQLNKSLLTVFFSNTPSGLSVKEVDHYLQEITSGYFRQYDYGAVANLIHYGSSTPPSYDIKKITAPLAFYYAKNDFLSSVLDVEKYIYQLSGDTADRYLIDYEYFNHFDFLTAKNATDMLYNRVITAIQKHNPVN